MEISRSLAKHGEDGSVGVAPNCSLCLSWDAGLAELSLSACPGRCCAAAPLAVPAAQRRVTLPGEFSSKPPACPKSPSATVHTCRQACSCLLCDCHDGSGWLKALCRPALRWSQAGFLPGDQQIKSSFTPCVRPVPANKCMSPFL